MAPTSCRVRVLLIDDNQHGLIARRLILQNLGYDVEIAQSGEEGVQCFRESAGKSPFSLVVTDYRMPGICGDEVIRQIRHVDPDVPLVILSGYSSVLALTPEATGADVVLSKGPHEHHDLTETVTCLVPEGLHRRGKPPASEFGSATASRPRLKRRRVG